METSTIISGVRVNRITSLLSVVLEPPLCIRSSQLQGVLHNWVLTLSVNFSVGTRTLLLKGSNSLGQNGPP